MAGLPPSTWIRDDAKLSTWLLAGACLQSLIFTLFPTKLILLPAILLLSARVLKTILMIFGLVNNPANQGVKHGPTTVKIPNDDGSIPEKGAQKGIVMFVLGTRSHHPGVHFAPHFDKIGEYFDNMWVDAIKNRETSGYLGHTQALLGAEDATGNTMIWLSYWKSVEQLQAWSLGDAHQVGMRWYMSRHAKEFPYIGIMHETYFCPPGNWESIYWNFKPFGMGQTMHLVNKGKEGEKSVELMSGLIEAKDKSSKSMFGRMSKELLFL